MKYIITTLADVEEKIYTGPRGGRYYLRTDENGDEYKDYLDDEDRKKEETEDDSKSDNNSQSTSPTSTNSIDSEKLNQSLNNFDSVWNSMDSSEQQKLIDSLDEEKISKAADLLSSISDEDRERIFDKALDVTVAADSNITNTENRDAPENNDVDTSLDTSSVERMVNKCGKKTQEQVSGLKKALEKHILDPKRKFFRKHGKAISVAVNALAMAFVLATSYLGGDFSKEDFGVDGFARNSWVKRQGEKERDDYWDYDTELDEEEDNDFVADDWDKAKEKKEEEDNKDNEDLPEDDFEKNFPIVEDDSRR